MFDLKEISYQNFPSQVSGLASSKDWHREGLSCSILPALVTAYTAIIFVVQCSVVQCTALYYNALQCIVVQCDSLH